MTTITLTAYELLTDRLLSASATRAQESIRDIQLAHQRDVAEFLAGVAARAGIPAIPPTAKRATTPQGAVTLSWEESPQPQPEPHEPPEPQEFNVGAAR